MTMEEKIAYNLWLTDTFCTNMTSKYLPEYDGYGCIATDYIHYGDEYCNIPYQLAFTSFDYFPWMHVVEKATHRVKFVTRILFEKFANTIDS
jgi:hypothetical protein